MEYRKLGKSGVRVSEICLGTMTFGVSADAAEAKRIVDVAFEAGVNFIDTANTYAGGMSERYTGMALKGRRDQVVLATKFTNPTGPGPNDSGGSRVHIMRAVEDCLERLQTDWLDIFYVHHVERLTPWEETLRALDDLVHQGKVHYIACSNYPAWRMADALWISETKNLAKFVCYQPQYNLVTRDIEAELVPFCLDKGLGIVCWAPLASGFLTGKYKPGQRSVEGTRSAEGWLFHERFFSARADETLRTLLEVAEAVGKSPAQVALRWALDMPGITSAIAGARTAAQFRDSCGASGWHLPEELQARLSEVSYLPPRYPISMEAGTDASRIAAIKMPSLD